MILRTALSHLSYQKNNVIEKVVNELQTLTSTSKVKRHYLENFHVKVLNSKMDDFERKLQEIFYTLSANCINRICNSFEQECASKVYSKISDIEENCWKLINIKRTVFQ